MQVTLITDASFCGQTGHAGYGYHIKSSKGTKTNGAPLRHKCMSSGEAELYAIWHGIRSARDIGFLRRSDSLVIQVDCIEAINQLSRAKIKEPIRKETSYIVKKIVGSLCEMKISFKMKHVKAHTRGECTRTKAHNQCDTIARYHMQRQRSPEEICKLKRRGTKPNKE